jgi:hypothetical protein
LVIVQYKGTISEYCAARVTTQGLSIDGTLEYLEKTLAERRTPARQAELRRELQRIKSDMLDWEHAPAHVKDWWMSYENDFKADLSTVVGTAQELERMGVTLDEYYRAAILEDTGDLDKLGDPLEKMRTKREAAKTAAAQASGAKTADRTATHQAAPRRDSESRWALEKLKEDRLDWRNTDKDFQKWWLQWESLASEEFILDVARQIAQRGATITDFWWAFQDTGSVSYQKAISRLGPPPASPAGESVRFGAIAVERRGLDGVEVTTVYEGSPATRLWDGERLRALKRGDVITHINDRPVTNNDEFFDAIHDSPRRMTVRLYDTTAKTSVTYQVNLTR